MAIGFFKVLVRILELLATGASVNLLMCLCVLLVAVYISNSLATLLQGGISIKGIEKLGLPVLPIGTAFDAIHSSQAFNRIDDVQ